MKDKDTAFPGEAASSATPSAPETSTDGGFEPQLFVANGPTGAAAHWPGVCLQMFRMLAQPPIEWASCAPQHKVFVTLAGGTTHTDLYTEGGQPYSGRDAVGDVSFVPAERCRWGSYRGGWIEYARLLIDPQTVVDALAESVVAQKLELLPFDNVRDPFIHGAVLALKDEAENGGLCGSLFAETLSTALAIHLMRCHFSRPVLALPVGTLSKTQMRKVEERMHEGLDQDVKLGELAASIGMSPDRFGRMFKNTTGRPPHRYLLELRLGRARELLIETDMPIAQIAYVIGLSSQSHLTRLFTRMLNITPHALRKAAGR